MNKNGHIIIIEDDPDDQFLMEEAFRTIECSNERVYFHDGLSVLEYFNSSNSVPFLILSDINMPKLNGFELREELNNYVRLKLEYIPFLFFTTSTNEQAVHDAYSTLAQGFFVKADQFSELQQILKLIVTYWKKCIVPNSI
ncbi:response regulator [Dyadobacter sp. CY323]|uniref:response regulator n=1 Tax=Dyadobacter sp. CY323 TaxID=2907302 RepID=UPI001F1F7E90|nr:response regulator [Dyadobacter sp. CY323]MCE6992118.1 response regulator [Dyadobacter sp. CY323]